MSGKLGYDWIKNLGLEAECAVALLPLEEQDFIRHSVAKQMNCICTQLPTHNMITRKQIME